MMQKKVIRFKTNCRDCGNDVDCNRIDAQEGVRPEEGGRDAEGVLKGGQEQGRLPQPRRVHGRLSQPRGRHLQRRGL